MPAGMATSGLVKTRLVKTVVYLIFTCFELSFKQTLYRL